MLQLETYSICSTFFVLSIYFIVEKNYNLCICVLELYGNQEDERNEETIRIYRDDNPSIGNDIDGRMQ